MSMLISNFTASPRILIKAERDAVKPNHKWLSRKRNAAGELVYTYHQAGPKPRKAAPGATSTEVQTDTPLPLRVSQKANDDALRVLRVRYTPMAARHPQKFRDYTEKEREKQKGHIESRLAMRLQRTDSAWEGIPHNRNDAAKLANQLLDDPKLYMADREDYDADRHESAPVHQATRLLVSSWAGTAADHDELAIALQVAAKEAFGLDDCAMDHIPWHADRATEDGFSSDVQYILDNHRPFLHAFLRAQYEETQDQFRQLGIKEVTLFRGFRFHRQDDPLPDWVSHVDDDGIQMPVQLQPMSSFGAEYDSCKYFAAGAHHSVLSDRYAGFMMAVTIPVEKVIGTCRTGFGCLIESEMVVLGGTYDSFVSKIDQTGVSEWGSDGNIQVEESDFIERAKKAKVWAK